MSEQDKHSDYFIPVEFEQFERKIYDLKQLIEISKGLNSTLEYNTLIDSILLTCMGQMQLLSAGIFLKKDIGLDNYFLHRNYKGFEIEHSREFEIDFRSSLIKFLESKIKCYTLDELQEPMVDKKSLEVLNLLKPDLIVPLSSKGELNGIIILADRITDSKFSDYEMDYLLNIAALAGIAIHNSTLYEMATTDMMTKLKIHHYFQTVISEEIERCVRYERPLSLIMADIDHFKQFNDTYGHSAGDTVIKQVAAKIKESIREIDIAARYGGEEFAIILPKTESEEAIRVAERLRLSIEEEIVEHNDLKLNVTISIGVTSFNHDLDSSKQSFIERADAALYESKNKGRNRVTFFK